MSYIGSSAAPIPVAFSGVRTQSFNGTGSASLFTLNRQVNLVTDIEVIVNNVQQSPFDGSYSIVNNGLGLQFSENPSAGTNNIYVVYRDQSLGSLTDPGAVRKSGDTMTGTLTVGGNVLAAANPGGGRVFGVSGGTNTTVVIQSGAAVGSGPNLELDANHYAYLDSNNIKFRSTDASLVYGEFDTAGRLTLPNQPAFDAYKSAGSVSAGAVIPFNNTRTNRGGHFNTSTYRFTAPIAGVYFVYLHCGVNISSGTTWYGIRVNGTRVLDTEFAGSGWFNPFLAGTLTLSVGDYVDALMIGAPSSTDSSTWTGFGGYLLG